VLGVVGMGRTSSLGEKIIMMVSLSAWRKCPHQIFEISRIETSIGLQQA